MSRSTSASSFPPKTPRIYSYRCTPIQSKEKSVAESISGATIYTLSDQASDEQPRIMAEKENASDLIAGIENFDRGGG